MKINNCSELWSEWMGGEETEETSKALLRKYIFKGTECGCVFKSDEKGIKVGGYNELGESAELPLHHLDWGFTIIEVSDVLEAADKEGVEEWHLANDEDLARAMADGLADVRREAYASLDMITEEEWNEENNKTNPGSN